MPKKPETDFDFYAGVDPGFSGGIGLINAAGTTVRVWDMPINDAKRLRKREIDLTELLALFRRLRRYPNLAMGIEWPTTRPGEGAERSERFGRGKGYLHAAAHFVGLNYHFIAPNLWKGRLGLPGKQNTMANPLGAELLDRNYPGIEIPIRGPRGGLKDGRIDALLIAHFLRSRSAGGYRTIVERFGKDSVQAAELVFARKTKTLLRMP